MCGIAGQISYKHPVVLDHIQRMIRSLAHRGPDDEGIYVTESNDYPSVGIANRRLSIIGINAGHQPIHNEDKTIWIVYNGEVYNFPELKADLVQKGHEFYTQTDTEVIVHLYEEYGEACVNSLKGMFAFAIWDNRQKKTFIARDRLGEKPLYYYWDGKTIIFASELKAIICNPLVRREIDHHGLLHYLQYSYIPEPLSIFRDISKLPAGHCLTVKDGDLSISRYWNLTYSSIKRDNEDDLLDELLIKIKQSVKKMLISDVPVGAFLSGGVDSSTIVAVMAQIVGQPVKTFSIGFKESQFNELPYARMVAKKYGTDHHEMIIGPEKFSIIETLISSFDEPFGDPSALPTYYVSQLARKHVKVVLSGDGGDELFAGYDRYLISLCREKFNGLPSLIKSGIGGLSQRLPLWFYGKHFLYNMSLPSGERFIHLNSHIAKGIHSELLSGDLAKALLTEKNVAAEYLKESARLDILSRLQYIDMKSTFTGDYLVKVDRMSMANSLEVRIPFLDVDLLEFANTIPIEYKIRNGSAKYILKKLAKRLVPAEAIDRRKQGFAIPLDFWFKGSLNIYLREILFDSRTKRRGYFSYKYLDALLKEHERGRRDHSQILWSLLILELWHRTHDEKG